MMTVHPVGDSTVLYWQAVALTLREIPDPSVAGWHDTTRKVL